MSSTKYIFGKPEYIEGIGDIHPVKLKDYDEFIERSTHLYISKNHFDDSMHNLSLLELLVMLNDEKMIDDLEQVFSIVTMKSVLFFADSHGIEYGFRLETGEVVHKDNFEHIRQVIMKQNLMFEQKVYKDKVVQTYMHKVFEARSKSSIKMEFEDMISTVSVFSGKHYWDLEDYTIYQLKTDFNRIGKFKNYDTGIAYKCVSTEPINVEHFAEYIDMFKNPYDLDSFTKSKDSIKKLDKSTK